MKTIYEFLLKNKTITSTQHINYVDLGLPSGLLWAKCNIGANSPADNGDYFMWGSTEPNTNDICSWENTPFNNGVFWCDVKYFKSVQKEVCPNNILNTKYDAVSIIMGDDWRLPTKNDFEELIDNTNIEWVNHYDDGNTNATGLLLTSKQNKNTLFIPATGNKVKDNIIVQNTNVFLWSSTLNETTPLCAWYLSSGDDASTCRLKRYGNRYHGFCLRGVKNK